jgi:hypothetical protein
MAYAALEQPDMKGAERVLAQMEESGMEIEAVHHSVLIHSRACVVGLDWVSQDHVIMWEALRTLL